VYDFVSKRTSRVTVESLSLFSLLFGSQSDIGRCAVVVYLLCVNKRIVLSHISLFHVKLCYRNSNCKLLAPDLFNWIKAIESQIGAGDLHLGSEGLQVSSDIGRCAVVVYLLCVNKRIVLSHISLFHVKLCSPEVSKFELQIAGSGFVQLDQSDRITNRSW
jgi:hypothetical protein